MKERNISDNPAKRPESRAKIAASRKGKPTTLGWSPSIITRKRISEALHRYFSTHTPAHKGRPLAESTKHKISEARRGRLTGAENGNWRGGTSPRDWKATRYKQFLRQVWARNRGACHDCGTKEGKLQVHHVISWIAAPELRYDPDNGILVCPACHSLRDRTQRKMTANGRQQLSLFATNRLRNPNGTFKAILLS